MISISGIDGSGKGVQIELLEQYLKQGKIRYIKRWARGSWTPGIELIKKIVRKDKGFNEEQKAAYRYEARNNPKSAKFILILSIIDLIWYFGIWYRILRLFTGEFICDRYIWDTYVDFKVNFSRFEFEDWIIWKLLTGISPIPDTSVLLVITPEMSVERGIRKNEAHMEPISIKRKKCEEYERLKDLNKWSCVIDANDTIDNIFTKIRNELKR